MSLSHKARMCSQAFSRIFARCRSCSSGVSEGKGWLWGLWLRSLTHDMGSKEGKAAFCICLQCGKTLKLCAKNFLKKSLEVEFLRLVYH